MQLLGCFGWLLKCTEWFILHFYDVLSCLGCFNAFIRIFWMVAMVLLCSCFGVLSCSKHVSLWLSGCCYVVTRLFWKVVKVLIYVVA